MSEKENVTFQDFIKKYGDCPEELFKIAKTPFEKAVCIEFFNIAKQCSSIKKDIYWLKYLITALFGVVILGVVAQYIPQILKLLAGA